MTLRNTTLDDISAVIGFTAALRLSAWFGEGSNVYVPVRVEDGQMLVRLLGKSAAKKLTENWPGEHLAVPRHEVYEAELRRRHIADLVVKGVSPRQIGHLLRVTPRRVQQIIRDLEVEGLLAPVALREKPPDKGTHEKAWSKAQRKSAGKKPVEKAG